MTERTPEEQREIEIFEENVIKTAQMMYPGKSSFNRAILDPIREKLRKNLDSMKVDKKSVPLEEAKTVLGTKEPSKKKKKK